MTQTSAVTLRPFFRYYGGKWRAAPHYPAPQYDTIVEPFAGAAGYACRYPSRHVVLVDVNPRIVGTWDYIIRATSAEIAAIPDCRNVDDLPNWVPQEGRWLVGWWLNNATTEPRKSQSAGRARLETAGGHLESWNRAVVERITAQQPAIRHWRVTQQSYAELPNEPATWFVDPPYVEAGKYYTFSTVDYAHLATWCLERRGQVIVCEAVGASWLPFRPLGNFKAMNGSRSSEAIWTATHLDQAKTA